MGLAEGAEWYEGASGMPFPAMTRKAAIEFLLYPIGGILGLLSVCMLILFAGKARRHLVLAVLISIGVLAGSCSAVAFLVGNGIMEIRHADPQGISLLPTVTFALVLVPPMFVAWRRLVLLWSGSERPSI